MLHDTHTQYAHPSPQLPPTHNMPIHRHSYHPPRTAPHLSGHLHTHHSLSISTKCMVPPLPPSLPPPPHIQLTSSACFRSETKPIPSTTFIAHTASSLLVGRSDNNNYVHGLLSGNGFQSIFGAKQAENQLYIHTLIVAQMLSIVHECKEETGKLSHILSVGGRQWKEVTPGTMSTLPNKQTHTHTHNTDCGTIWHHHMIQSDWLH